jgi:hypothetical protein
MTGRDVAELNAALIRLGYASRGQPGASVLTATSTRPAVSINLDASQRTEVRRGDRVAITLPSGRVTPGTIASVGTVAAVLPGASAPTVVVQVTPVDPRAGRGLESAPVTVAITTGILPNALTVPVTALLARSAGGYAVEVAGAGDGRQLIPVTLGLADSAAGLVAVTGPGLAAGQRSAPRGCPRPRRYGRYEGIPGQTGAVR